MSDELVLKREAIALQAAVPKSLLNDIESVKFIRDSTIDALRAVVRGSLFCKEAGRHTYKIPASWFDHLKESSRLVRALFGKPKYKKITLFVRVTLDPESYRINVEENVGFPKLLSGEDFVSVYKEEESVIVNEMKFYPCIYKTEEFIDVD